MLERFKLGFIFGGNRNGPEVSGGSTAIRGLEDGSSHIEGKIGDTGPEAGQVMEDGTIFAGISPDTGDALYVTREDAPHPLIWDDAIDYADELDAHGHDDWRLPTRTELQALLENSEKGALKGTFNEHGTAMAPFYWSSSEMPENPGLAYMQHVEWRDRGVWFPKIFDVSIRPVRSEPRPVSP